MTGVERWEREAGTSTRMPGVRRATVPSTAPIRGPCFCCATLWGLCLAALHTDAALVGTPVLVAAPGQTWRPPTSRRGPTCKPKRSWHSREPRLWGCFRRPVSGCPPTAVGYPPTTLSYPPTAPAYPPTAVCYPSTAVGYPPTAGSYPPTDGGNLPTAGGHPATAVIYPPTSSNRPRLSSNHHRLSSNRRQLSSNILQPPAVILLAGADGIEQRVPDFPAPKFAWPQSSAHQPPPYGPSKGWVMHRGGLQYPPRPCPWPPRPRPGHCRRPSRRGYGPVTTRAVPRPDPRPACASASAPATVRCCPQVHFGWIGSRRVPSDSAEAGHEGRVAAAAGRAYQVTAVSAPPPLPSAAASHVVVLGQRVRR